MNYLSVCSGIEAATVAWHPLGWSPVAFAEIEPFPCRVLRHHYPTVPNLGDMTKFKDWPDAAVDVLVGGTPCQSFSIAGLRKGLDDPRGNLMLTYGAIAAKYRPRWLVWENVPGVLSSNSGRDFGAFLGMLGQLGYGFSYRVLDAQFFGVPQRRRRVFVVGCLGDWRAAAAVLFEPQGLRGDSAPRRETRENPTAGTLLSTDGGCDVDHALGGQLIAFGGNNTSGPIDVATACRAKGVGTLNANGKASGSATQQDAESGLLIPVAFDCKAGGNTSFSVGATPGSLRGVGHGGGHTAICIQAGACRENPDSGPDGVGVSTDGVAYTIEARAEVQATCTNSQVRRLTPRECERLQGFPDDYTNIPGAKDGPRYKAIGNSMAVPVMAWIGQRLAFVDTIATRSAA